MAQQVQGVSAVRVWGGVWGSCIAPLPRPPSYPAPSVVTGSPMRPGTSLRGMLRESMKRVGPPDVMLEIASPAQSGSASPLRRVLGLGEAYVRIVAATRHSPRHRAPRPLPGHLVPTPAWMRCVQRHELLLWEARGGQELPILRVAADAGEMPAGGGVLVPHPGDVPVRGVPHVRRDRQRSGGGRGGRSVGVRADEAVPAPLSGLAVRASSRAGGRSSPRRTEPSGSRSSRARCRRPAPASAPRCGR